MNEICYILTGKNEGPFWIAHLRSRTEGTPASVEFDGEYAEMLEDKDHNVIGFYHTHPGFTATPSRRDHRTMRAWYNCFGKPLLCVIKGIDGLRGFIYANDSDQPLECEKVVFVKSGGVVLVASTTARPYGNVHENDDAEIFGLGKGASVIPTKEEDDFQNVPAADLDDSEDFLMKRAEQLWEQDR